MGNYSLVANSTFKAKDFDEMIKPYMMYTADYNAQEEALSELATKADIWQGLANEQTDPVAYAQYTNYANALKDQAAIIASSGLNPTSRQTLLDLKRRYASEIAPIETAYNTRKAQAEEQRKALLQNPTLLLSRRADTTSLDDYMKNPNLGYDAYSGALLTQQVGQVAANIAKELRNYGKGRALDGFTKTWLQQHGYSASEVAFAINHPDDPRASGVLNTIVNNVMSDSGIANWADSNTLNQAYNYARQGLWQAVGQTQVGTYTDEAARMRAAKEEKEEEEEALQTAREEAVRIARESNIRYDFRNVMTDVEREAFAKDKANWEEIKDYFYKDEKGLWKLKPEGRKLPLRKRTNSPHAMPYDTALGAFLKEYNLTEMYHDHPGPWQTAQLDAFLTRLETDYDSNIATEYYKKIDSSDYPNVVSALSNSASSDGKVYNYKRQKQDGSYTMAREDEVDITGLKPTDIRSANVVFGEHGSLLEVRTADKTITVPIRSYSQSSANMIDGNTEAVRHLKQAQKKGKTYIQLPNGTWARIQDVINTEINAMGDNAMSSLGSTQITPEKVNKGQHAVSFR